MSVVANITPSNIGTTGVTINYTLNSFASNIYLYRFQSGTAPNPLSVAGTLVQTVVPGTSSGSYTDSSLTTNTQYTYAFYNGNVTGTATPYSPTATLKTYADVTSLTTSAITETSTQVNYSISNKLSATTTCYLYRFSSATSIPSAPTTLNTATGTFVTSINVSAGSYASPLVVTSNYVDSTLSSNISYIYAFYSGQVDSVSTILTDLTLTAKSATSTTFTTVTTSTITSSNISNKSATINYNLVNAISASTSSYLFRFAASSAPTSDPTSGVQIGSAIATSSSGSSSTPINATGLSANTQYTFAFYNGTTSSSTILRDATSSRVVQSVSLYTTNVLNTNLTASSITPVSATINYTLSNTPSSAGTTVYLYRFSGTNSAPTTLTGGTSVTSVALTANYASTSGSFSSTGLTANNQYTYAFYSGNTSGTSTILTSDGSTAVSVSIDTTVTTVAFTAITNILNTSATVNYTLTNTSSNSVTSYLYRFVGASAPALLNTSTGTFIASANSIGSAASTNNTGLTGATQYTYAFYNGQSNGASSILTNVSGVAQSTTFSTTNLFDNSITTPATGILNTQVTISYTLTDLGTTTSNATAYLYRFAGGSAPTTDPTSGIFVTSVVDNTNTTVTSTYTNTGLTVATQYTYAFYNSNTSAATILTNSSLVNQSVTVTTTNIVLNTLTASNITNNSAQINYNISNATTSQGTTVYLYRFTTVPSSILSGGTNIISGGVAVSGSATVDSFYNNTGLSSTTYYYAFYNGNTSGTSTIIPIAAGGTYITVKDFVDISILTATGITTTSANINYTINNGISTNVTSYLYRFAGSTAPATNPTSGTNVTSVLTNSGTSSTSTYADPSLNINTIYTYAFYTGTSSGATILTDTIGNPVSVTFITFDYIVGSITASSIAITSATINYSITNPLSTQITSYLVRFVGNTAPSSNPTTGTQVTTVTVNANSSLSSQTFSSTGLTQNTYYTYAFYTSYDASGKILTNLTGAAQSVSLFTDMYVRTLSLTYVANTYFTISYRLGNGNNSVTSNTSYLYRFAGSSAPSTLNTSIGTQILSTTTTSTSTAYDTGVVANTQYTYAFYDGSANGVATIMNVGTSSTSGPTYPLSALTATNYTSNQVLTTLSQVAVFNASSALSYSITNSPASSTATVYLYRFTTIPANTLPASGATNITIPTSTISANGTLTNTAFSNTGLTASTTYYYAFYNGNTSGTSSILPISGAGNYITVQTTGVTQSAISVASITSSGATISYAVANAAGSSTATLYLYRYTGVVAATTPLNTSTGTQVTSVSPAIPITLAASGSSSNSITVSDLSANTIYSFQFYDGSLNGSSPILSTIVGGGTNQFVSFKTGVSDTALSNSNVSNTYATISYTLSNTNSTNLTSYLYRFPGSVAPATLNTSSGVFVTSIDTSSGTVAVPTVNSGSYSSNGLTKNTTYVYAFYNGQSNGSSTILTNTSGTAASTSFTTANLLNTSLTTNSLTSTSVTIGYTLTNNSTSQTAYLYRFTGSSAPSTLDTTSGTNIIVGGTNVTASGVTSTSTNSSLTQNTTYTYAFYNGNTNGSSTILTSNGTTPVQLTIFTTTNCVITVLSPTGLTSSQTTINYTIVNYQNVSKISYLYRFAGSSAPSTLNTSTGTSITNATTAAISGGTPGTTTSSNTNTGLTANTTYTYGFYSGNVNGTSVLLTNYSGTELTATVYTTSESIVSSLTSSTLSNTFNTINYVANNNQPTSRSLYLYRFPGTTAPSPLNLSSATLITNFTLASGGSSTSSIFDPSLVFNTNYTYAFYNGNTSGVSTILTNYDGSPQVLNISTTDVFNSSLTATDISTSGATIDYTITNSPSASGIILYLYRFTGLSAPTTLTTSGSYSSATQLTYFADPGGATVNSAYVDNSLSANTNYTYAFYNGNVVGTSTILQDNSTTLNPVSVTLNTYFGIVSSLSTSSTTNTSTNVNYVITTDLTDPGVAYLFRFDGSINVPSTLDTGLTGATNVVIITLPSNSTLTSYYYDPTLSNASQYTYAIYNGNSNGTSSILTNASNLPVQTVVTTNNGVSAPTTYDISTSTSQNSAVNITLVGTDPQSSALTYTYTNPTNGTISGTAPNIVYTPAANYVGSDSFTYYATNTYSLSSASSTVTVSVNNPNAPCFKEGTKILCFNKNVKKDEYVSIENIRKGTLVKTIYNGYVKVDMIGRSSLFNSGDSERTANRLYVCKKKNYPKLFEDLVITGYHSILVTDFKDSEQREKTINLLGEIYITDNKYRLPACIDDNSVPYEKRGEFTIWHLALENKNYIGNYGIYANGLLVESCSKRYLKELSNMELIQ